MGFSPHAGFFLARDPLIIRARGYVGPLQKGSEIVLTYSVAYPAAAPNSEAARALMKFLTTPDAVKVLKKNGLEPG